MITLHHLNNSRSQRIIWLLETLNIEYQIKHYQRDKQTNLAPAELKKIHPLGKSPVITEGDKVIAESGLIIEYLCETYGSDKELIKRLCFGTVPPLTPLILPPCIWGGFYVN